MAKQARDSNTYMRCNECSIKMGKDVYLCNSYIKGMPVNCHRQYHLYHHNKKTRVGNSNELKNYYLFLYNQQNLQAAFPRV